MRYGILTSSDAGSRGEREDESGDLLADLLSKEGYEVVRRTVPDEEETIADEIASLAQEARQEGKPRRPIEVGHASTATG